MYYSRCVEMTFNKYSLLVCLPAMAFFNLLATGYQYAADLVALEHTIVTSAELSRIVTPLHAEAWGACLQNHPDRLLAQYIKTQGRQHNFKLQWVECFNAYIYVHRLCASCSLGHTIIIICKDPKTILPKTTFS